MPDKPLRDLGDPRDDPHMIDARSLLAEHTARRLDEAKAELVSLAEQIKGGPLRMDVRLFFVEIGMVEWDLDESDRNTDPMKARDRKALEPWLAKARDLAGMANKIHQTYPG